MILLFSVTAARSQEASDVLLTDKIHQVFLKDSRLPIDGISIFVLKGAVRLRGQVETVAQKGWMEEMVHSVDGVVLVDNKVVVTPHRVNNQDLANSALAQLINFPSSHYNYKNVKVTSQEGHVTLEGVVRSWGEKMQAEEVLGVVKGVRKITNKLKVRDSVNRTDKQIKRAVLAAIRGKVQTGGKFKIEVSVLRGMVTLKGLLKTDRQRRQAIRSALFVHGVADVNNKIKVQK